MADDSMPGESLSLPSPRIYFVCHLVFPAASELICKFPYLFFPRDTHDSFRIVVKAFAQESSEPSLDSCSF